MRVMIDEAAAYRAAIDAFVKRAKAYAKRRGVQPEHISKLLFSDRRKIAALSRGGSLKPETFDKAARELDKLEEQVAA